MVVGLKDCKIMRENPQANGLLHSLFSFILQLIQFTLQCW